MHECQAHTHKEESLTKRRCKTAFFSPINVYP